jgi:chemotaxis protein methyltransferase CheR
MGLDFPRGHWGDLERQTQAAAADFGFTDAHALVHWLFTAPQSHTQTERLAAHLTIPETYFWREPRALEALRDSILPGLVSARRMGKRTLRLWSAGCSTGEEAYSIAMVLRQVISSYDDWQISLLATDINLAALRHAALGVYGDWSFRTLPLALKEKYFFRRDDGKFQVVPEIKKMVTFAYLNLAGDGYPSPESNTNAMDVIFCRNVLLYFGKDRRKQAAQRLYNALTNGGWLTVAAAELSEQIFAPFTSTRFPGTFIYRRAPQPHVWTAAAAQPVAIDAGPPVQRTRASPRPSPAKPPAIQIESLVAPDLASEVRGLANQGKLSEALAACEHALAANKLDPALHYLHAIILTEQNSVPEAKEALKRALYLAPDFVLGHFALGKLAFRQGNASSARKSFRNALALLSGYDSGDILPEADGLTAGRLTEVVRASLQTGPLTR